MELAFRHGKESPLGTSHLWEVWRGGRRLEISLGEDKYGVYL